MADERSLARLQRWMQEVITHPDGVTQGIDSQAAREQIDIETARVEEIVEGSSRLGSTERLAVYGNAYFARLIECLGEEFPATRHALGEETFDSFALGYIQHSRPSSYSLSFLGERFAQYLKDTRPTDVPQPGWPDFLIDLATLERTYAEVFDGPGPEDLPTLRPKDVQAVPPEQISQIRLIPVPSLRLLELSFPVHEYVTAVRRQQAPEIPKPAETLLVITRRDYVVRRGTVSRAEYTLLQAILKGSTLGESIAAAADSISDRHDDELAAHLSEWFQHWSAAGWFHRVELPGGLD